jgi:hypothetical protein
VRSRVKKIRSLVGSSEQTDLMKVTISTHMAPRATHKSGASGTQGVVGSLPVLHHMYAVTGLLCRPTKLSVSCLSCLPACLVVPACLMVVASFLALATGLSVKRRTVFTGVLDYR